MTVVAIVPDDGSAHRPADAVRAGDVRHRGVVAPRLPRRAGRHPPPHLRRGRGRRRRPARLGRRARGRRRGRDPHRRRRPRGPPPGHRARAAGAPCSTPPSGRERATSTSRCGSTTTPPAALYASEGFAELGVRRGYYDHGRVDAVVMHRQVDLGMTIVMGIETSCDETGVGFVHDGVLLGDALASSMDEHARFGGVVPEIAARAHVQAMVPTVHEALAHGRHHARRRRGGRRHGRAGTGDRAARRASPRRRPTRWRSASRSTACTTSPGTPPPTPSSTARCRTGRWP